MKKLQAMIQSLEQQRNWALTNLTVAHGDLQIANDRVQELEKVLSADIKAKKEAEVPPVTIPFKTPEEMAAKENDTTNSNGTEG